MQMHALPQATLEVSGGQGTTNFGMDVNAHMFRILSDGLYSDKISAVLREIACNGYDAHVMAGTPERPIEVKLPGLLSNEFYVKDWGPGLTDAEVRELFSTYGRSTKQGDSNVTGGFGLGSKSPFAYTDQFTITAVKNGVMNTFIAHKDNEEPRITLMSSEPARADWQSGVQVGLVISPNDFEAFRKRAVRLFRWFAVRPTLVADDEIMQEIEANDAEGVRHGDYLLAPAESFSARSGRVPSVVMANVRYPIQLSELGLSDAEAARVEGFNPTIFVPNGALMPTPSREGIQYSPIAKTYLKHAFGEGLLDVLKALVVKAIEDNLDKSYADLVRQVSPLTNVALSNDFFHDIVKKFLKTKEEEIVGTEFKNLCDLKPIVSPENYKRICAYRSLMNRHHGRNVSEGTSSKQYIVTEGFFLKKKSAQVARLAPLSSTSEAPLSYSMPSVIVYEDCPGAMEIARMYLRQQTDGHGMVFIKDEKFRPTAKGNPKHRVNELREHAEFISRDWYLSFGKAYGASELIALMGGVAPGKSSKAKTPKAAHAQSVSGLEIAFDPERNAFRSTSAADVAAMGAQRVFYVVATRPVRPTLLAHSKRARENVLVQGPGEEMYLPRISSSIRALRDLEREQGIVADPIGLAILSKSQAKKLQPESLGWVSVEVGVKTALENIDLDALVEKSKHFIDPQIVAAFNPTYPPQRTNGQLEHGWLFSTLGLTRKEGGEYVDPELAQAVEQLIEGTELEQIRDSIERRFKELGADNLDAAEENRRQLIAFNSLCSFVGLAATNTESQRDNEGRDEFILAQIARLKALSAEADSVLSQCRSPYASYDGLLDRGNYDKDRVEAYLTLILSMLKMQNDPTKVKQASTRNPRRKAADDRQLTLSLFCDDQAEPDEPQALAA